jgi:hypothetical protein
MDVLEKLQQTLRNVNKVALGRIRPGDSLQMHNERSRLQEQVRGASRLEEVPLATIEDALRDYRQDKYLKGLRQIRLVCYGCTQGSDAVIESREAFEQLLGYVERYKDRRRTFRKLYRALLGSYFSYDPDAADISLTGRSNWEELRKFLADYLDSFPISEFSPDWLSALAKYPDLLGEHPGQSLDIAVLQGDWSVFNEIRERLELDGGSWLVRQLVMAPVMAAQRMDDSTFKEHLHSLLLLLHEYPLYAGAGLKIMLDRYVGCADHEVHAALRDFAIGLWGNPWLAPHQWQCGELAREMLSHWLKRQLLSEFFGILSDDGEARRLNFWDIYSADLTGMYFALGRDAYAAGNMPLYKFRSHAKGLMARLPEEKHGVHICIMQFEHHHVVEFNHESSAAYFYDTRQGMPSFYFGKGWVDIGAIGVQDIAPGADVSRVSKPMRHQDSRLLAWEGKFAQELGATDNAIVAFCAKYQCVYDDLRCGSQWVRPSGPGQYGPEVWSVLTGWGFKYSIEENAYFRLTH